MASCCCGYAKRLFETICGNCFAVEGRNVEDSAAFIEAYISGILLVIMSIEKQINLTLRRNVVYETRPTRNDEVAIAGGLYAVYPLGHFGDRNKSLLFICFFENFPCTDEQARSI